ncbi:DNA/RNA nuclease SfsA [Persephonella sp.]|uniref:DNA/RNA nuclease SfsA n=1 Tax=Persephonella sp. TaxID=2060922 RepID=UPI0025E3C98D|nr:DNA/RNA nuclease SfsA [Persephonella sp.]
MVLFDLKKLGKLEEAEFIERPNRFVGLCRINGSIKRCHIADSGRLKEILTEGRKLLVVKNPEGMKTDYKILAARMEEGWILLNTSIHSKIGKKAIEKGVLGFKPKKIRSEVKYGNSRIDFLVDENILIELKGSNLLVGRKCLFPDAPTSRGKRHLEELIKAVKEGYQAFILIMVLRDCSCFETNKRLDPAFSDTFAKALKEGVKFAGFKVEIDKDLNLVLKGKIGLCR